MAFTTVVTHATGDVFPASDWNTYVRDDIAWVHGRLDPIAYGKKTSSVTSSATTFAGGTDVLASALSFTADGTSDYLLVATSRGWNNATASTANILEINLDGADRGAMATGSFSLANAAQTIVALGVIATPAAGAHTVNARLYCSAATLATMVGGAGGVGADMPILVALMAV